MRDKIQPHLGKVKTETLACHGLGHLHQVLYTICLYKRREDCRHSFLIPLCQRLCISVELRIMNALCLYIYHMLIKWPTWLLVPKRQQGLTEEPRPRPPQVSSSHPLTSLAQGRDSKPTSRLKDRLSLHFSYFDFLLRKLFHFYGEEGIEQKRKP